MFTNNCHFTFHLSLIQADLLGDEAVSPTPVNGKQPTGTVQSNQDLLAEIFGPSSTTSSAPATASSPPTQRSKVDDILNLFGTSGNPPSAPATPHTSAVPPSYTSPPSSLFTPAPTQAQSPPTPAVTAQSRLTSYTAYDKNDIKITLTPQTSAARPGVVMILARFQVSGSEPATGLSFQAAVPKVRVLEPFFFFYEKFKAKLTHFDCKISHSNCKCFPCRILLSILVLLRHNKCVS